MTAPLPILLQHPDFYVIDKPPGITVQHDRLRGEGVLERLAAQTGETLYPVHRLDADTSGALIVARTVEGNRALSAAFRERQVHKTYLAISDRTPSRKQGWVRGDMERTRRGAWRLLRSLEQPAVTRFISRGLGGPRLFLLFPETGKTHQLRVALKSLGAPILGDALYGGAASVRLHLHAWALAFEHGGERFEIRAPLPQTGEFDRLQTPETLAWLDAGMRHREGAVPDAGE